MSGKWIEAVRLSFKGARFRDHALDLTALGELAHFQKLIAETAKELWKAAHPTRERLPAHFEERTRLCLRRIQPGSATTPMEVYIEESAELELFEPEPFRDLTNAVDLAYRVYAATAADAELPDELPREMVADYARWGETLAADEAIEIRPVGRERGVLITDEVRRRLAARIDKPYEDPVDLVGDVLEANVRQGKCQLWPDGGHAVTVSFTESQEAEVTTALKEHKSLKLRVRGRGEFLPGGRLQRIFDVDQLSIVAPAQADYDRSARPIEDVIAEIVADVPPEVWEALPEDLSDNLDHYLYGTPKK
ncbi:MAG: hypothetical protein WD066_17645 [Planctomycetaceae bacterium]